jgi:hypothetical protein
MIAEADLANGRCADGGLILDTAEELRQKEKAEAEAEVAEEWRYGDC